MIQLLRNFSPVVKQITQSEIGTKATMTIQSKTTEVSAINFSVNHLRGEFTTGQERPGREYKETVVIGILSDAKHFCLREAQRKTFIPKAKAYKLLNIKVFFLLDEKTIELEKEQERNQDILFLNTTFHGWGRHFALKLHIWLRYVVFNVPSATLIGRMDDDAFVCAPQMFERLNKVKDKLLYYGYTTGPRQECVDEMFLIVGVELAKRVANRHFCQERKEENCLLDGNAGHKFRSWIKIYDDFVLVDERVNRKIVWFYKDTANKTDFQKYKTFDFCSKYLLFHKATVSDIYDMQLNNSLLLRDGYDTDIAKAKTNISRMCLK